MNKLTQLSIRKFRNVAPTTLEFSPGLNVLLGKNAAGKTTLLRLLSVATRMTEETLQDDELDMSYRVSSDSLELVHSIKKTRIEEPSLTLDVARPVREEFPRFQQTDSFVIEQKDASPVRADVLSTKVVLNTEGKEKIIERQLSGDAFTALLLALIKEGKISAKQTETLVLAQPHSAGRMDESLDRFAELLRFELRREGRSDIFTGASSTTPTSMVTVLLDPVPEGTSASFAPAFLTRAAQVLNYESASARFDIERLSPQPSRQTVRFSNLRFFFKRPGEEVSHDLLSYGQKRLLAFYAHVDASTDVIIADELVNGLHHEWISACLSEIGARQAFLTSQNPLLLDFLRFNSAEDVRRTFILCERVMGESGAQLIWRNPTVEEAESFFSAYETGIQRISDILLTKGLW